VWNEALAGHSGLGSASEALAGTYQNIGVLAAPLTADDVAHAVWDEARSGHTTDGSFGDTAEWAGGATPPTASAIAGAVRTELATELAHVVDIHGTDLPAVKAETALIVEDTGTTLPASLLDLHGDVDAARTSLGTLHTDLDAVAADALAAHTKVDALHDFDPATDTVARVTLVDTTTTNTDALEWLYNPPA
jgi:hypothetical protein